jgi:NADP-dependent 3-hydroxy acid dehydrogenase YdfG
MKSAQNTSTSPCKVAIVTGASSGIGLEMVKRPTRVENESGQMTARGERSVLTKRLEPIGAPFAVISLWGQFGGLRA